MKKQWSKIESLRQRERERKRENCWRNAKNREILMVATSLENYALTFFYRSICRHCSGHESGI